MKLHDGIGSIALVLFLAATSFAQLPAAANDATAKWMVDMERRWAESGCTGEQITAKILARSALVPTRGTCHSPPAS